MSSSVSRLFSAVPVRIEEGKSDAEDFTPCSRGAEGSAEPGYEARLVQTSPGVACDPPQSDEALMVLVCDGRKEALAELFRRYARIVRGVAYRVLRDASEADDHVQDIFLLIQRLCKTFDGSKGSARFWILQMTHRRAISRRRYLASRHFYNRLDLDEKAERLRNRTTKTSRHADSVEEVLKKEETLQSWFDELSPNQQETLRLFFFEGYTFEEIAAKLGQTTVNARNHYYRGLDRLRKQIFAGKLPGSGAL